MYVITRVVAIGVVMAGLVGTTQAQTIIAADTFAGRTVKNAHLTGTALETSLSGGSWVSQGFGGFMVATTLLGDPPPAIWHGTQAVSAVSLADHGSYKKPAKLRISADFQPYQTNGNASDGRGMALGFFSAMGDKAALPANHFTGLVLDAAGNLSLVHDPNDSGIFAEGSSVSPPIAYAGDWNPNTLHTLSYEVDTATGHISNVALQGSTADYSEFNSTTFFTDAATTFAGMYFFSAGGSGVGIMDNFKVTSVAP